MAFRISESTAFFVLAFAPGLWAQGTLADYERAQGLQAKARGLVVNVPGTPSWIGKSEHFWYSRTVKGGTEFLIVDAEAGTKKPAFDHDRLAAAISGATGKQCTGLTLPFAPPAGGRGGAGGGRGAAATSAPLSFADDEQSIRFGTGGSMYRCTLSNYECRKDGAIPEGAG